MAKYADVALDVTSTVRYHDGCTEEGPGTTLRSRVSTQAAAESVWQVVQDAVNDLHRKRFGASVRHGLLSSLKPLDPGDKWHVKLEITYHVTVHVTDDQGSTLHYENYSVTRPI